MKLKGFSKHFNIFDFVQKFQIFFMVKPVIKSRRFCGINHINRTKGISSGGKRKRREMNICFRKEILLLVLIVNDKTKCFTLVGDTYVFREYGMSFD